MRQLWLLLLVLFLAGGLFVFGVVGFREVRRGRDVEFFQDRFGDIAFAIGKENDWGAIETGGGSIEDH